MTELARATSEPSTNSEASPSDSVQFPMSPFASGRPVVRVNVKPIRTATGSAAVAAQMRRSLERQSPAASAMQDAIRPSTASPCRASRRTCSVRPAGDQRDRAESDDRGRTRDRVLHISHIRRDARRPQRARVHSSACIPDRSRRLAGASVGRVRGPFERPKRCLRAGPKGGILGRGHRARTRLVARLGLRRLPRRPLLAPSAACGRDADLAEPGWSRCSRCSPRAAFRSTSGPSRSACSPVSAAASGSRCSTARSRSAR